MPTVAVIRTNLSGQPSKLARFEEIVAALGMEDDWNIVSADVQDGSVLITYDPPPETVKYQKP